MSAAFRIRDSGTGRGESWMPWDPMEAWPRGRRWLWAVLAVASLISAGPLFVRCLQPPHDLCVDFFQEWASARNLFCGLPPYTSQHVAIERHLGLSRDEVVWPDNL